MTLRDPGHLYDGYDDPTGVAPRGLNARQKSPLTTNVPGQHLHNYPYDPSDTDPEEGKAASPELAESVNDHDLWVDTTPDEE